MKKVFDKSAIRAILGGIGCESLMSKAAVATVKGDNFQKKSNTDSLYSFESAGRALARRDFGHVSHPGRLFFCT